MVAPRALEYLKQLTNWFGVSFRRSAASFCFTKMHDAYEGDNE
jgi:hypothetical protein